MAAATAGTAMLQTSAGQFSILWSVLSLRSTYNLTTKSYKALLRCQPACLLFRFPFPDCFVLALYTAVFFRGICRACSALKSYQPPKSCKTP